MIIMWPKYNAYMQHTSYANIAHIPVTISIAGSYPVVNYVLIFAGRVGVRGYICKTLALFAGSDKEFLWSSKLCRKVHSISSLVVFPLTLLHTLLSGLARAKVAQIRLARLLPLLYFRTCSYASWM